MTTASEKPAAVGNAYLREQESKSLLRFLTCGSVDDGKSTLIGRLLYDTKLIFDDQLSALRADSRKHGTTGEDIDLALLVDGLEAEREQGITIDVAYRFFATPQRKFIVADTPGHEEYTRNMATGASTAGLAVVLVDARKGLLPQTSRHSHIASLLGIRHIVLAVNKMDLVGFDQSVFDTICADYRRLTDNLGFQSVQPIPMSARFGDNVVTRSGSTGWYDGPSLLEYLESVDVDVDEVTKPFRFPVQYVSRPNQDFRGIAGQVASGRIAVGDKVIAAKSGISSTVKEIVTFDGSLEQAQEGQPVTLVLEDDIDISRGNMRAAAGDGPHVVNQFQSHIIWFDAQPMIPGREYVLRTETDSVSATVTTLKYSIDINTLAHTAATSLKMNDIGVCNVETQAPICFDAYRDNRTTGNFVIIDRLTNRTLGAGMIDFPLRRATNIQWQALDVDRASRAALKGQKPAVVWFTGLSGAGKSTVANRLEKLLHSEGRHTYLLDGDNVRHGLNKDLGFKDEDRVENIRRVAEVAKLMADAGLVVIVSFISPFRSERRLARELMVEGDFFEVFIDTPLEECERRDPKGLYQKARRGEIQNFTGISSPYEPPENPELQLSTVGQDPEKLAVLIAKQLRNAGKLDK